MTKNKRPEKSAEKCPCPCHTNPTVICCQDCALAHPATVVAAALPAQENRTPTPSGLIEGWEDSFFVLVQQATRLPEDYIAKFGLECFVKKLLARQRKQTIEECLASLPSPFGRPEGTWFDGVYEAKEALKKLLED
jgi:hypothetical protein